MKLYYYRDPSRRNFGDDLNPWLWSRIVGDLLDDNEDQLFIGIGTILDRKIPRRPEKVVVGAGIGYGRMPRFDHTWRIICVRGPLTAAALGLPDDAAITDPAILVRDFVLPSPTKRQLTSFMPHHKTIGLARKRGIDLSDICDSIGFSFIDPTRGTEEVLAAIADSGVVIAEAMHGAIVADALRIPWIAVQLSEQILRLKWWDWCRSLGMEYVPHAFPIHLNDDTGKRLAAFLQHLHATGRPQLSDAAVSNAAMSRLRERLLLIRQLYGVPSTVDNGQETAIPARPRWGVPNIEVLKIDEPLYELHIVADQIESLFEPGTPLILVDQEWIREALNEERQAMPFLERDGQYWGQPPNDETAIRELERLRAEGARHIVFAWPAFWWLDYYRGFRQYLEVTYPRVLANDRLIGFDLRPTS